MAITAQQMRDLMVAHGITVHISPHSGEWFAMSAKNTRLHKGTKPTPEDAVEAAAATVVSANQRRTAADAARLYATLATGRFFQRVRLVPGVDPDGNPITVKVWDIRKMSDNSLIVTGETSLAAAIIAAEVVMPNGGGG